jgi:hypothetical protein
LFCLYTAILGQVTKLGVDASAVYAVAELLICIFGAYCILICFRVFSISRLQGITTVLLALAAVPLRFPLDVWRALKGSWPSRLFFVVDGLFVPGALSVGLGTVSVFACLILLTQYVRLSRRKYLYLAGLVGAFSGLCHPFEVFTIMAATTVTLIVHYWPSRRRALTDSLVVIIPGLLSVLPYVFLSLTIPWVHRITALNVESVPDLFHLFGNLGIPAIFVLANLILGVRLRGASDIVLQCWFVATLLVLHIPHLPWVSHTADGLALVTALLAVRQVTQTEYLRDLIALRPRLVATAVLTLIAPAIVAHAGYRYMSFRDYRQSAIASQAEYDLIGWFRQNGSAHDLVIAPDPGTSWMLATAPVHTIASHWLFSVTYAEQAMLRDSFYKGVWTDETARGFLSKFGINYVVVPEGSPVNSILNSYPKAAIFPPLTLYFIPGNHMSDRLPEP